MVPVTESTGDGKPVEIGKHHVEHDQIGPEFVDRLLGCSAGAHLHRLVALVAECSRDRIRDRGLVVDDEHAGDTRGNSCDLGHRS